MHLRIIFFTIIIGLFASNQPVTSQTADSTTKAIEIYKNGTDRSHIIHLEDRVLVPCSRIKGKQKDMVIAELVMIDSNKMYFQPLDNKHKQTLYTRSSLNEIGFRTTFRVLETLGWIAIDIYKRDFFHFLYYGPRNSFKVVSLKSGKWRARIIDDET